MLRQIPLLARRTVFASLCLLPFLCPHTPAQTVKITVKCEPPAESKTAVKDKAQRPQNSKTPKLVLNIKAGERSKTAGLSPESQAGVITKDCVAQAVVTVGPSASHANQIVLFNISQTNDILGLRWNTQSPYVNALQTFIQLDANGSGTSPYFLVLGEQLGTTTLLAESPGFDDALLDIIVVECNCPIIPVSSPPRN